MALSCKRYQTGVCAENVNALQCNRCTDTECGVDRSAPLAVDPRVTARLRLFCAIAGVSSTEAWGGPVVQIRRTLSEAPTHPCAHDAPRLPRQPPQAVGHRPPAPTTTPLWQPRATCSRSRPRQHTPLTTCVRVLLPGIGRYRVGSCSGTNNGYECQSCDNAVCRGENVYRTGACPYCMSGRTDDAFLFSARLFPSVPPNPNPGPLPPDRMVTRGGAHTHTPVVHPGVVLPLCPWTC